MVSHIRMSCSSRKFFENHHTTQDCVYLCMRVPRKIATRSCFRLSPLQDCIFILIVFVWLPATFCFCSSISSDIDKNKNNLQGNYYPSSLMSSSSSITEEQKNHLSSSGVTMAVATRLHLGNAKSPPSQERYDDIVQKFYTFASKTCGASSAVIAVDATPKFPDFDLPTVIQTSADRVAAHSSSSSSTTTTTTIRIVPVQPWGKFVTALNVLVSNIATVDKVDLCMFVSAETETSRESVQLLCHHVLDGGSTNDTNNDTTSKVVEDMASATTLVAGAYLQGHEYHEQQVSGSGGGGSNTNRRIPLTGRTTPWNTLAIWNLHKLALTGFPLVADGLHSLPDGNDGPGGVEEVTCIALLQKLLGEERAVAKLVKLPGVEWEQQWEDEERRKWHEQKMNSKVQRPARHLELTGLQGWVTHC